MYYEIITSPCYGTVEKVSIDKDSRIYEWEPLFAIKNMSGKLEVIKMGCSGEVQSLEVEAGDKVIPGMVLAYVQEDIPISGSD
ncbi:biotin/lipoyl attachment domain-containing protein [Bacillus sp. C1]